MLVDLDINGEVDNIRINHVDVGPLTGAELDGRYPERAKLHPSDADGHLAVLEARW